MSLIEQELSVGWSRRGYPIVKLDGKIPWEMTSDIYRSWNFHIHCWDMLDNLLKAYSINKKEELLKICINIALDWTNKFLDTPFEDCDNFAWYDMAVGLRAYRLAYIIDAALDIGLLSGDKEMLFWKCLLKHQEYLANDSNIIFHNNHGFYQVAGQLAMGMRFYDKSDVMREAFLQGNERMSKMLKQQFSADGIHREHSPDYHRMVCLTLRNIVSAGLISDNEITSFVEKVEKALSWFIIPNGNIVNFGDSDSRSFSCSSTTAKMAWSTPEMHLVCTKGKIEESLPPVNVFNEGGYFVARFINKENYEKSSYLAQIAAFHSRTHKHADDLSFVWYDRGTELIVDAGRYGYIGKTENGSKLWQDGYWYADPNRIYCESTRAHNTLEFDNENYPRKGVKPYGSAIKRWCVNEQIVAFETECKHFKSIRRVRLLIFNPAKWLIVYDWFHDNLKKPHNVKQWFHMSTNIKMVSDVDGYRADINDESLTVRALLPDMQKSRLFIGETSPIQGWYSPKERQMVPNYTFCFERNDAIFGNMAAIFTFSSGKVIVDYKKTRVTNSGRKGIFCWQDDDGTWQVNFERLKDGELTVLSSLNNDTTAQ
ncbi:MAG: heparinase II/III family protein [Campylobacteraceae bacterium]|nr:heparinase II/III family protein [Campylobacteraceae bacterium]